MDRIFKVITSVGKDVEKLEPSFNTGWKGNVKQCSHFGKQFGNSSNCFLKNRVLGCIRHKWLSNYGPWTGSIRITCELVRIVGSKNKYCGWIFG